MKIFKFTILFIVVPYSLTSLYCHDAPNMSLHFPIASLKLFNFGEGEQMGCHLIIIFSSCSLKKSWIPYLSHLWSYLTD